MPENNEKITEKAQSILQKKRSVGTFPRLPLSKSIELASAVYEVGQGEPARRISSFDRLGKSADSGSSRQLVSSSNVSGAGYGLIKGGYQAPHLELTENGRKLVDGSLNAVEKSKLIYEILFSSSVFSQFVEYWQDKPIPKDEVAIDWFQRNINLPEQDAKACWLVIKDNILAFNLFETASDKQIIINAEVALKNLQSKIGVTEPLYADPAKENKDAKAEPNKQVTTVSQQSPQAQVHFNIQIHLPEKADPETYNTIFKGIAEYVLGKKSE